MWVMVLDGLEVVAGESSKVCSRLGEGCRRPIAKERSIRA